MANPGSRDPAPRDDMPDIWDDLDDAIFDLRVRKSMSWRQVGAEVGRDHSVVRRRFYDRMGRIEPADVHAMRTEENEKLDMREGRAWTVFNVAMLGTAIRHNGRLVTDSNGEPIMKRELGGAINALRELDRVARSRYKLNGLEAPIKIEIEASGTLGTEMDAALDAYLRGIHDGGHAPAPVGDGESPTPAP